MSFIFCIDFIYLWWVLFFVLNFIFCIEYICLWFTEKDAFSAPFLYKFFSPLFLSALISLLTLSPSFVWLPLAFFSLWANFWEEHTLSQKQIERISPHITCFQFFYFKSAIKTSFKLSKLRIKSELDGGYFRVCLSRTTTHSSPIIPLDLLNYYII